MFKRLFFISIIFSLNSINAQLTATIKYSFYSPLSNYSNLTEYIQTNGIVSSKGSQLNLDTSQAFVWLTKTRHYDSCHDALNPKIYTNSIAIIQRGGDCTFSMKITRARQYGARGVIVYDPKNNGKDVFDMLQNNTDIVALYVQRSIGSSLFELALDNKTHLMISIEPVHSDYENYDRLGLWHSSRGAILFLVISVCILIFLCSSWVIFYAVQRYRLRTSKDRLENRLTNAAKKALAKISLITINEASVRDESCVICLDSLKIGDTIRQLACEHRFHQHCVDPWLINHRHCPLCNLDILVAYRVSVPGMSLDHSNDESRSTSLVTNAPVPIVAVPSNERNNVPIPSISGSIKDERV